jgi:hypothetical protein
MDARIATPIAAVCLPQAPFLQADVSIRTAVEDQAADVSTHRLIAEIRYLPAFETGGPECVPEVGP